MELAKKTDKQLVVKIISETFWDNPGVNTVIKNDSSKKSRIECLAEYAFEYAQKREGVYLSADKKGVAICFNRMECKKYFLSEIWLQAKLIFNAICISRLTRVMKREKHIKKIRPMDSNYLYFWFFGVLEEARSAGTAKQIKDFIFSISEQKKLPIYAETTVEKNKRVYEFYGFKTYHTWKDIDNNITVWFMKRDLQ